MRKRYPREVIDIVRRLRREGATLIEISQLTGIPEGTVSSWLAPGISHGRGCGCWRCMEKVA